MADPLLHRLPLADPSSDSLGRLNGQYPALTYVDCADDVGVPLVAAHLTAEPIPGGTVVCMCVAASGGWTAQRSVWRRGEFNPAAAFLFLVGEERGEHTPSLVENAAVETALLGNVLARFFDGAVIFRTRSFSSLYTPWLLARPVASLCRKSLRTLASCIRSRDIFAFSLCQLDENLTLRASLCCSFASLSRMPSKALTGSISWPTEVAANTATPRSMPIGSSVDFDGSGLFFCHKTLTNHSPAFRRKVTERRSPPRGRYPRKRTQPILGSLMAPWRLLSRLNSTSSAGSVKESFLNFFRGV